MHRRPPRHHRGVGPGPPDPAPPERDQVRVGRHRLSEPPVQRDGLQEHHRVLAGQSRLQQPLGVVGGAGVGHRQARGVGEVGLGRVGVELVVAQVGAHRHPDHHRRGHPPPVAPADAPGVADDLVEGRVGEPGELDLGHRPQAGHGHAHRRAHDAGLAQRRVDHPAGPELLEQPLGHPEHPALEGHVLAQRHQCRVPLEGRGQGEVERLSQVHVPDGARGLRLTAGGPDFGGGHSRGGLARVGLLDAELVGQGLGHAGEEVPGRVVAAHRRSGLQLVHRRLKPGREVVAHRLLPLGRPQAPSLQELAHPGHRVLGPPLGLLLWGAVHRGAVVGGVRRVAVGVQLDQGRAPAPGGPLHRLPGGGVDGQGVHAVHQHPVEPVGGGLGGQGGRGGLLVDGGGLGHLVVLAQEHGGGLPHPGEVEGRVEVRLRGGAVAEHGHGHRVAALAALGAGEAHRVGEMGADGGVEAGDAIAVDVPDVGVVGDAHPEADHARGVHAPGDPHPQLPVGGEDPVLVPQGQRRAHVGLLAAHLVVSGHPPLALEVQQLLVGHPGGEEVPVHLDELPVVEVGRVVDQLAAGVEDAAHGRRPGHRVPRFGVARDVEWPGMETSRRAVVRSTAW